jgi:hypothetical protein
MNIARPDTASGFFSFVVKDYLKLFPVIQRVHQTEIVFMGACSLYTHPLLMYHRQP